MLGCLPAMQQNSAYLVFEDGTLFPGRVFAGSGNRNGEVVFNTAMAGYQEVITDPSYCGQMVVMTYPLIGSYGIHESDWESRGLFLDALIVKEYIDFPTHFNSQKTLKTLLDEHNILGIEGVDTRALTRYIRDNGAKRAFIITDSTPVETVRAQLSTLGGMQGVNLADKVTTPTAYVWQKLESPQFKVAVIDCGVKFNILRLLTDLGCECHVLPNSTTAEEILSGNYDGMFISNGPGDPEPVTQVIECIRGVLGKKPIFGICLGHQLLGLALGAKTFKLKFGHHGANHPVKNLKTGKVEITSQNHGFNVDVETIDKNDVEITHINLNDMTVEGIRHKRFPAFSVQYHPEAAPGPNDPNYLFQEFFQLMREATYPRDI